MNVTQNNICNTSSGKRAVSGVPTHPCPVMLQLLVETINIFIISSPVTTACSDEDLLLPQCPGES